MGRNRALSPRQPAPWHLCAWTCLGWDAQRGAVLLLAGWRGLGVGGIWAQLLTQEKVNRKQPGVVFQPCREGEQPGRRIEGRRVVGPPLAPSPIPPLPHGVLPNTPRGLVLKTNKMGPGALLPSVTSRQGSCLPRAPSRLLLPPTLLHL